MTKQTNYDQMIKRLRDHFTPVVRARIDHATRIETTVEFVEEMQQVNGLRFAFIVHLKPGILAVDLKDVCEALEYFTHCEDTGPLGGSLEYEGYQWRLGDGDDTQAVYMHKGTLCIWLRGWKE